MQPGFKRMLSVETDFTISPTWQLTKYWTDVVPYHALAERISWATNTRRTITTTTKLYDCHINTLVHDLWGAHEAWPYLEGRKEPKEQVAVVFFVHSQVSSMTLDVSSWQLSNHTQFPGWKQQGDQMIAVQIKPVCGFRSTGASYLHLWRPSPGKEWEKGENRDLQCLAGWRAEISGRKKASSPTTSRVPEWSTAAGKRGFPNTACRNIQVRNNTDPEPVLQEKNQGSGWNQF